MCVNTSVLFSRYTWGPHLVYLSLMCSCIPLPVYKTCLDTVHTCFAENKTGSSVSFFSLNEMVRLIFTDPCPLTFIILFILRDQRNPPSVWTYIWGRAYITRFLKNHFRLGYIFG